MYVQLHPWVCALQRNKQWLTQNHKTLFKIQNLCQNCWVPLPAAIPTCSFTKGSVVLTPCPLAQDTLACSLHLVSDPWTRKTLPKTWVAGSYTHFSPQRKLPENWIHSEGVTMPCPGHRQICKNVRILSGEYSYPMSQRITPHQLY